MRERVQLTLCFNSFWLKTAWKMKFRLVRHTLFDWFSPYTEYSLLKQLSSSQYIYWTLVVLSSRSESLSLALPSAVALQKPHTHYYTTLDSTNSPNSTSINGSDDRHFTYVWNFRNHHKQKCAIPLKSMVLLDTILVLIGYIVVSKKPRKIVRQFKIFFSS